MADAGGEASAAATVGDPTVTTAEAASALAADVAENAVEVAGRLGLAGHGVYYLVLGSLVGRIASRSGGDEASASGAVSVIARQPFGQMLLALMTLAFAAYAFHRVRNLLATDSAFTRFTDVLRIAVYCGLAFLCASSLVAGAADSPNGSTGEGGDLERSVTATLLDIPGGQVLVAIAGGFLVAVALRQGYQAVRGGLDEVLDDLGVAGNRVVRVLGTVGYTGRTVAYGLSGGFVVEAALLRDATNSQGLDGALRDVAGSAVGPVLLWTVAVGFLTYGAFRLTLARYRDVEPNGD